ncbi:hypothetical protein [Paenibacillus sp. SAFN-117]|uniref:hypothetical protein n=1 Tax=Paenibacillus sp. SAFN-117 TaxID=3436860 RepID=UPI003F812309
MRKAPRNRGLLVCGVPSQACRIKRSEAPLTASSVWLRMGNYEQQRHSARRLTALGEVEAMNA